jgi:oligopeptide/dipeptide ABC transporter ATP-binding protein
VDGPILEVRGVTVSYKLGGLFSRRILTVLNGITLGIRENEVLGLIGESGCGKTTLGKVIAGLIKPAAGRVEYRGKDVWSMGKEEFSEFRRSVQYLHQDPYSSLNPVQTVYTILSRPLLKFKLADRSNVGEAVMKLLEAVGLTPPQDFIRRYPHQLSGGQRQRVALARIMSVKPKVLVADEPVSMVDASQKIEILNLLLKLREETRTAVVYITHDLATLRYVSREGRVAVMYLGKIVELANVDRVVEKALHPYTQTLLNALLEPDPKLTRTKQVKLRSLDVQSLLNPPPGCRFNPRCPLSVSGLCDVVEPNLIEVYPDHRVACHLVKG